MYGIFQKSCSHSETPKSFRVRGGAVSLIYAGQPLQGRGVGGLLRKWWGHIPDDPIAPGMGLARVRHFLFSSSSRDDA